MQERHGARGQVFGILTQPDSASLKRIAWAYGCAKKGSDEERQLLEVLLAKARSQP